MKIKGQNVLLLHFELNLYIKLLIDLIPQLSFIEIAVDFLNVLLLVLIVMQCKERGVSKMLKRNIEFVGVLFLYCIVRFVSSEASFALFMWGMRNTFRFLIVFLAACVFMDASGIERLFQKMYRCLWINVPIIVIQFLMGYERDLLGGTFGMDHNCNAIVTVYLLIMVTYHFLMAIHGRMKTKKALSVLGIAMVWAAAAEIKLLFLQIVFVLCASIVLVKGRSTSKFKWLMRGAALLAVGAAMLALIFPEQVEYITDPARLLWYLQNVKGGVRGFGRTTALSMTNKLFFMQNNWYKVFGMGLGSAEFMNLAGINLTSAFYDKYQQYSYFGYFTAMKYIELGALGLSWYFLFWTNNMVISFRRRRKANDVIWYEFALIFCVCTLINALKDSTLMVSASGYMTFLFMAVPYIASKRPRPTKRLCRRIGKIKLSR